MNVRRELLSHLSVFLAVNEQCRSVASAALAFYSALKAGQWSDADGTLLPKLKDELDGLDKLMKGLPTSSGDIDVESVGRQLEDEMSRMDAAIQNAVAAIEALQKKARENSSGVR